MITVKIKDNESIERALKRFKKKFQNIGVVQELRGRQAYQKPSVERRKQVIKAKYIQKLRDAEAGI